MRSLPPSCLERVLLLFTADEFKRALRRGETVTNNRRRRARVLFTIARLITHLPYTRRLSLLVDRIVIYAEGIR